jgi:16S rRNA (cytosine967-C5)-methyltransferase
VLRLTRAIGAAPDEAAPTMARLLRQSGGVAPRDGYWARLWTRAALRHWLVAAESGAQVAERAVLRAARLDEALRRMPYEVPFLFLEQRASLTAERAATLLAAPLPDHLRLGVSEALWDQVAPDEREAFFAASMLEPPLTVRLQPGSEAQARCIASLERDGLVATPNRWSKAAFDLTGQRHLFETEAFGKGWLEVQDASSQALADAIAALAPPEARLLDLCAGRGGKSLALAAARPDLHIVATDLSVGRLSELPARATRAGARRLVVRPELAAQGLGGTPPFELVLADAPCTGAGTLRRHPELRLRDAAAALRDAVAAQREVLRSAWEKTAPGGLLIYATCSVVADENETQVAAFVAATPDACMAQLVAPDAPNATPAGALRFWPQRHGTDGFFAAAIRRNP